MPRTLLEFDIGADAIESEEGHGIRDDPVIDVLVTVEVGGRPPAVLLPRGPVVQRVEIELLQ